jgi:tyrosyl-tRNA synthetase
MINVNYLLEKDVIARRLETGISYAEFSYTLLQGYDFLHLFETENIVCQAGGSDQWGNITTGLEMIRKNHGHNSSACCFSIPLLLKPDGTKFGKSESGAIYLDAEVTSPYEMYQFCLNVEDSMIEELLKKLTFLNQDEITSVMTNHSAEPFRRHGQKALGKEIICDIHGEKTYHEVVKMSEALFSGKLENLSNNELYNALLGTKKVFKADKNEYEVCELLVLSGMVGSKTEGRKLIEQKALSINGQQINDVNAICSIKHAYKENSFSYIKKGKKDYLLIK